MARYTSFYKSMTSSNELKRFIFDMLRACDFDVIYDRGDYVYAREVPGGVDYSKLVTVEVLIDPPKSSVVPDAVDDAFHMNFVVKNEELPLRMDNHCRRKFNLVNEAIQSSEFLEVVAA
ncbi:MAG: hypothetical protein VKL39_05775 [Leptolyngbyaceae bacterium]|nr:hypothetical protein [Leptolyngbyaceae bacterium]